MRFVKIAGLNSLSLKVLLAYVAGVVLSIMLVVAAAVVVLQGGLLARMDLDDAARDLASEMRFDTNGRPVGIGISDEEFSWIFDSLRREAAYRVLDDAGNVALLSEAGNDFWPATGTAAKMTRGSFDFEQDGVVMHGATEPVLHNGRTWYLQIAASTRLMTLLHRVALPLVGGGIVLFSLVLLAVFGLFAWVTLRYTFKPLREVSESAAAIAPRSIHARLRTDGVPAEIVPLVDSFNRVLERLEKGYRVQQEFLGNAAHELKTPLALIRAQIELGKDDGSGRKSLLGDVEYMARQVQQLLLLAEASEAHNYRFAVVRVQDTVLEAVAYLQRMAEKADVRLVVASQDADVWWRADRGGLFTLLKNLLENAIEHAPHGTHVSVNITAGSITVRDLGPGVTVEQIPQLFERFWRGEHRRESGAGLGLAICQEIALAHGWRLSAEIAVPGLRFEIAKTAGVQ